MSMDYDRLAEQKHQISICSLVAVTLIVIVGIITGYLHLNTKMMLDQGYSWERCESLVKTEYTYQWVKRGEGKK